MAQPADQFSRSALLLGEEGMNVLQNSRVAVFGVGGVGGYAVEALARSGVGALDLIDMDRVSLTNLNRQILALHSTLGMSKVEVAKARCLDINPEIKVRTWECFYLPETAEQFDFTQYDYVVDAIDTVAGKVQLAVQAKEAGTPIISCMGAGNKLDPTRFQVTDLSKTTVCPLARAMRTQQPLVAGHGDHIRAQRGKRYVQNARRLRGVHQQGHAVGLERARKLLHRLHDAGHVAGMADHAQRRARRDRGGQRLRSDQPQAVGREHAHADGPLLLQPLEHAHHGIMLGVGADHLVSLA